MEIQMLSGFVIKMNMNQSNLKTIKLKLERVYKHFK